MLSPIDVCNCNSRCFHVPTSMLSPINADSDTVDASTVQPVGVQRRCFETDQRDAFADHVNACTPMLVAGVQRRCLETDQRDAFADHVNACSTLSTLMLCSCWCSAVVRTLVFTRLIVLALSSSSAYTAKALANWCC